MLKDLLLYILLIQVGSLVSNSSLSSEIPLSGAIYL